MLVDDRVAQQQHEKRSGLGDVRADGDGLHYTGDSHTNDDRKKATKIETATNEQEFEFYTRIYCNCARVEGARRP